MKFMVATELDKFFLQYWICEMGAIPSKEKVHLVKNRNRDMRRVHHRSGGKTKEFRDIGGKLLRLWRDW